LSRTGSLMWQQTARYPSRKSDFGPHAILPTPIRFVPRANASPASGSSTEKEHDQYGNEHFSQYGKPHV
jgi:hypothetical protein